VCGISLDEGTHLQGLIREGMAASKGDKERRERKRKREEESKAR
jgi:hypothetical protein